MVLKTIAHFAIIMEPFITGTLFELGRNYTPFPEYFPRHGHVCHIYFSKPTEQFFTITVDSYIDSFYGRRVPEEKQLVQKSVFVVDKST